MDIIDEHGMHHGILIGLKHVTKKRSFHGWAASKPSLDHDEFGDVTNKYKGNNRNPWGEPVPNQPESCYIIDLSSWDYTGV